MLFCQLCLMDGELNIGSASDFGYHNFTLSICVCACVRVCVCVWCSVGSLSVNTYVPAVGYGSCVSVETLGCYGHSTSGTRPSTSNPTFPYFSASCITCEGCVCVCVSVCVRAGVRARACVQVRMVHCTCPAPDILMGVAACLPLPKRDHESLC
jgi:hypothetical protein